MFTGIIEEIGTLQSIQQKGQTLQLTISCSTILEDVKLGDSIAINGVCLTVTSFTNHKFTVDVMPETFQATSLKHLSSGSKVNLERAMIANGRFGGHIVSGHVDTIGKIKKREMKDNAIYIEIGFSGDYDPYVIYKGSITVDGTSLTIFRVDEGSLTISLIPHTASETILGSKKVGEIVNLEFDILAKYVESMLTKKTAKKEVAAKSSLSVDYLKDHGFY